MVIIIISCIPTDENKNNITRVVWCTPIPQSLSFALSTISTSPYFLLVSWWNVSKNFKVREVKKWQHQGQGHITDKSMIWLVEWGKIIMLHVQDAFWCNTFLTFSAKRQCKIIILILWFWRQCKPTAVNHSFFEFTWKPFLPSKWKYISLISYMTNIGQSQNT